MCFLVSETSIFYLLLFAGSGPSDFRGDGDSDFRGDGDSDLRTGFTPPRIATKTIKIVLTFGSLS